MNSVHVACFQHMRYWMGLQSAFCILIGQEGITDSFDWSNEGEGAQSLVYNVHVRHVTALALSATNDLRPLATPLHQRNLSLSANCCQKPFTYM